MLPARCTPLGSTRRTLVLYRDNRRFLGIPILGSNHTSSNSKTHKMRVRVRIPMGFCHIFGPKIDIPTSSTTREHADRHGRRVTSFIDASSQAPSLLPPRDDGLQDGAFDAVGDRHDTYYYYRIAPRATGAGGLHTRILVLGAKYTESATAYRRFENTKRAKNTHLGRNRRFGNTRFGVQTCGKSHSKAEECARALASLIFCYGMNCVRTPASCRIVCRV